MPNPAVTFDGTQFTVVTNDPTKDGTYPITVVATFGDSPATVDTQVTFSIEIDKQVDACVGDFLTYVGDISDDVV